MGKSLVGIGDQQLGSEDSSVTIFIWCMKDWFEKNLVLFNDSRVFFLWFICLGLPLVIIWVGGKMVVNKERGYYLDHTKEE